MSEGMNETIVKDERKFMKWLRGNSKQEHWERMGYTIIFSAAAMIFIGLLLGSFVPYIVYIGSFGAFLLLVGISIYIVSQLIENKTGSVSAGSDHSVKD